MSFSPEKLREAREAKGMSRLGLLIQFDRFANRKPPVERTLAAWERGDSSPNAEDLAVLAAILECEVQSFFA